MLEQMTYCDDMYVVPQVVSYGKASSMSLTAYGTPSSGDKGLCLWYLPGNVAAWQGHVGGVRIASWT